MVASVPVPQKQVETKSKYLVRNIACFFQCYKKPRKVCQTLVTTKPKVVTEQASVLSHEIENSNLHTGSPRGVRTFFLEDTTRQKAQNTKADGQTETFTKEGKGQGGFPLVDSISIESSSLPGALHVSRWSWTTTEAVRE